MNDMCCILAVVGHPDDETIHFGGTLARYAASGARVVCVTATRGELGDIVDPSLATAENFGRLGEIRMAEMGEALGLLGHVEGRWLGYRDSGMAGDPANDDAEAFCRADLDEVAGRIARIIRETRPHVVITLRLDRQDDHPDHRHAALAARSAFERAGDPGAWSEQLTGPDALTPWSSSKLYQWHGRSNEQLDRRARLRRLVRERGLLSIPPAVIRAAVRRRPGRKPVQAAPALRRLDATTHIAVGPWIPARDAAIRTYRTQIAPTDPMLDLSPGLLSQLSPTEDFTLLAGRIGSLPETDLLEGLSCVSRAPVSTDPTSAA